MTNQLACWHRFVTTRDTGLLDELLAADCVFHSPVVYTPQRGRAMCKLYLSAAIQVFSAGFRYVREVGDDKQSVLEFIADHDGIEINGVDIIDWDAQGQICQFKVMVRPLKAINLLHEQMKGMLERMAV